VRPPPVGQEGVLEPADQRARRRPHERRQREEGHGRLHVVAREEVADGAARHGEEGGPGKPLEEARDDDGLDVLRDSRGYEEYEKGKEGNEVDGPAAVELGERRPKRAEGDAEDEGGQADGRDEARRGERVSHGGVGRGVDSRGVCAGGGVNQGLFVLAVGMGLTRRNRQSKRCL
jgi:hypothetical protein